MSRRFLVVCSHYKEYFQKLTQFILLHTLGLSSEIDYWRWRRFFQFSFILLTFTPNCLIIFLPSQVRNLMVCISQKYIPEQDFKMRGQYIFAFIWCWGLREVYETGLFKDIFLTIKKGITKAPALNSSNRRDV